MRPAHIHPYGQDVNNRVYFRRKRMRIPIQHLQSLPHRPAILRDRSSLLGSGFNICELPAYPPCMNSHGSSVLKQTSRLTGAASPPVAVTPATMRGNGFGGSRLQNTESLYPVVLSAVFKRLCEILVGVIKEVLENWPMGVKFAARRPAELNHSLGPFLAWLTSNALHALPVQHHTLPGAKHIKWPGEGEMRTPANPPAERALMLKSHQAFCAAVHRQVGREFSEFGLA